MYEAQLAKAKIEKAEIGADFNKERLKLQKDLLEANKNIEILISREENMKEQVELYAAQYDELVNGVDDKKKHFGQFKKQMDTLNKRLKTLEMDSSMWKEKFEGQYYQINLIYKWFFIHLVSKIIVKFYWIFSFKIIYSEQPFALPFIYYS